MTLLFSWFLFFILVFRLSFWILVSCIEFKAVRELVRCRLFSSTDDFGGSNLLFHYAEKVRGSHWWEEWQTDFPPYLPLEAHTAAPLPAFLSSGVNLA